MSKRISLLLLASVVVPSFAVAPPGLRRDRYGDPLPTGAIARLGSVRLRHLMFLDEVVISPDGSKIASMGPPVRLWDRATGRLLGIIDADDTMCFTPDSKHLVSTSLRLPILADQLHSWDIATGKKSTIWPVGKYRGSPGQLVISPDGKLVAVVYSTRHKGNDFTRVYLFDLATKKEQLITDVWSWGMVKAICFSPDSRQLVFVCRGDLCIWDVPRGREIARFKVGYSDSLAISPDGKVIAVHEKKGRVTFVRPGTAIPLHTSDIRGEWSALCFSKDGKEVFSGGPVIAIDPTTAKQTRILVRSEEGSGDTFSADGRWLVGCDGAAINVIDTSTGKRAHNFDDHRKGSGIEAVISPNGQKVATRSEGELRIWDLRSGRMLRCIEGKGFLPDLRWTSDGQSLVAAQTGNKLGWWSVATGKRTRQEPLPSGVIRRAALLSGDTRVSCDFMVKQQGYYLHIRDLTQRGSRIYGTKLGHDYQVSPDGSRVLQLDWGEGNKEQTVVRVLDARSGKTLWQHEVSSLHLQALFSPLGDRVVVLAWKETHIWDAATGRQLARFPVGRGPQGAELLGLSPDGRTLLVKMRLRREEKGPGVSVSIGTAEYRSQLIEVATGGVRHALPVLPGIGSLDFSRDGRHLVTGHGDGTALVWEMNEFAAHSSLDGVWKDLASPDARKGFLAVCSLAASPRKAIEILGEKLKPANVDGKQVRSWLADLGPDRFEGRLEAEKQLKALGTDIEDDLLKAAGETKDLEVRQLLVGLGALGADDVRRTRSLEVLERIDSPAAVKLVKRLADGHPGSRLTREAKETLRRMERAGR